MRDGKSLNQIMYLYLRILEGMNPINVARSNPEKTKKDSILKEISKYVYNDKLKNHVTSDSKRKLG